MAVGRGWWRARPGVNGVDVIAALAARVAAMMAVVADVLVSAPVAPAQFCDEASLPSSDVTVCSSFYDLIRPQ